MTTAEWVLRFLNSLAANGMLWFWIVGAIRDRETQQWILDSQDPPTGIELAWTDKGAAWLRSRGLDVPEPLQLRPHLKWRPLHRRTRTWLLGVPAGTPYCLDQGIVELTVEYLPERTRFAFLEVDLNPPPRNPRGGKTIGLRLLKLSPVRVSPQFG